MARRFFDRRRRRAWRLAFVLVAGLFAVAWLSLSRCRDTHVRLDFAADRLAFTLVADTPRLFDDPLPFERLMIEDFEQLRLDAAEVRIHSPVTQTVIDREAPVVLTARGRRSSLLLHGAGRLGRIQTPTGSRVVLETHGGVEDAGLTELTLLVTAPQGDDGQSLQLAADSALEIEGRLVMLGGLPGPPIEVDHLRLAVEPTGDHLATLESRPGRLTLTLTTPTAEPFSGLPCRVRELELVRQELDGQVVSSLARGATLTYPDDSEEAPVELAAHQFLTFEDLEVAELTLVGLEPAGGIAAVFEGLAGNVRAGTRTFSRDLCVSVRETVVRHPLWSLVATLLGWVAGSIPMGEMLRLVHDRLARRPEDGVPEESSGARAEAVDQGE